MKTIETDWLTLRVSEVYRADRRRADIVLSRSDSDEEIIVAALRNADAELPLGDSDARRYAEGDPQLGTAPAEQLAVDGARCFFASRSPVRHVCAMVVDDTLVVLDIRGLTTSEARNRVETVFQMLTIKTDKPG